MENMNLDEKYLTFGIGEDAYGIDIGFVDDIIGVQNITYVPNQPHYIKGVINLRGQIIPVLDVRMRFNQSLRDYDDRTCIIVIKVEEIPIGVVVDRVLEVAFMDEKTVPSTFKETTDNFMTAIGKYNENVVLLVDCHSLLDDIIL